MVDDQAHEIVLQLVDRVWNGHDLDLIDDLFPSDFDNGPGREPGATFIKEWHRSTRESFPDLRYTVDEIISDGQKVALRWTATGTQLGQFGPIPPTGKVATYAGAHFVTIANGKIVSLWSINDTFGKVTQLGAIVTPPAGPS